ncbi:ABC transporter ATP-binding protein [Phyllobacterium bourgognense]|uniref:Oligopeptide transport system ATP-binding protein n=1 Tax=Phyllobacterium bourgognense TaxID=314236 RepID=A0A368YRF5_9HYPH|nr:ABC transporter ATP-binding protein [Phyllobacterium bourgognense]RCW81856.1 oligopeptide transport system ATP-binding protein [Phyllobacterium bourgognense]
MSIPYLSVRDLSVSFLTGTGAFYAIDGISFDLARGEILALVGESGSGKSMTSLSIMKLLPTVAQMSGRIEIEGQDISAFGRRQMEDVRGARIGMIFQEPMTSLNPVLTIARQMTEGPMRHNGISRREALATAYTSLEDVGIPEPDRVLAQYPHQLSGGMRQRIMIAAALALRPGILIADEPTTALDVTVQSQVLDLLVDLKSRSGSGILLITHDIGVVAETADRVAVMRGGRILETGTVDEVLRSPQHDYTKALLASHLTVDKGLKQRDAEVEGARP